MENELYNAEQVADYFHVGVETVRDWIKRGILHGFKAGRDWRFTKQNIEDCTRELQAITEEKKQTLFQRQPGLSTMLDEEGKYWADKGHKEEWEETKRWILDILELNPRVKARLDPERGILISLTSDEPTGDEKKQPELVAARR